MGKISVVRIPINKISRLEVSRFACTPIKVHGQKYRGERSGKSLRGKSPLGKSPMGKTLSDKSPMADGSGKYSGDTLSSQFHNIFGKSKQSGPQS